MEPMKCKKFVLESDGSFEGTKVFVDGNEVQTKDIDFHSSTMNEELDIVLGLLNNKGFHEICPIHFERGKG